MFGLQAELGAEDPLHGGGHKRPRLAATCHLRLLLSSHRVKPGHFLWGWL